MSDQQPNTDLENLPAPTEGNLVTQFLTCTKSRARVLFGRPRRPGGPGREPMHRQARQHLRVMNPGGAPTPDKPEVTLIPNERSNRVSSYLNLRVADIKACYRDWSARGAEFLTEPLDRGAELRCYMRDPDGYLIEVGSPPGCSRANRPRSAPGTCRQTAERQPSLPPRYLLPSYDRRASWPAKLAVRDVAPTRASLSIRSIFAAARRVSRRGGFGGASRHTERTRTPRARTPRARQARARAARAQSWRPGRARPARPQPPGAAS